MSQKGSSRKHEVRAQLQFLELTKAGTSLNLRIFSHKEKIGELEIGRGSLWWLGRNRKRRKKLSWTRFAELMDRSYERS